MTEKLHGQVAVVTGGGRGIGRAIALALAKEGMRVVCSARSTDEIESTVATIIDEGGAALAKAADVTSLEDMESLMATAAQHFGRLDFVLLNAGVMGRVPSGRGSVDRNSIESLPIEIWNQCIATNLTGVFFGMRAAIPYLRSSGGGKFVGVGSVAATRAPAGLAPYSASKAGLTTLIKSASRELRQFNIAVNELQPGRTATAMHGITQRDLSESDIAELSLTRRGPEDEWFKAPSAVAELALFMAKLPNDGPSGQIFALNTFR